jgi:hypothetical protein
MKKLAYLIASLLLLTSPALFAGWSEPIQLTHRGFEINPQIIAVNDTLHLAWFQLADSNNVSYLRSIDGGQNWGEIRNLNPPLDGGSFVSLTKNEGRIFAGWSGLVHTGHVNIGYSLTTDGNNWTTPAYMVGSGVGVERPTAATISGDSIYGLYFANSRDSTGNIPFRFLYSSNLGQTWSNEQTVAYTYVYCNSMLIKKCGGVLYIVLSAVPVPESTNWQCQVIISYDGGATWLPKIILSQNNGREAQSVCASCNELNGFFAIGWMDYNYPGRFFIRITRNLGYTWMTEIQNVTDHYISDPNLCIMADTIWATWVDWDFADNWQIGYSKSTNLGQTWSEPERMNYTTGLSMTPSLSYDNGKVHLVWQEDGLSGLGRDIYYRRWEPGDNINEEPTPSSYGLLKCYPNPFNSNTVITFSDNQGGEIEIYDISGRLIKSLPVKDKSEGSVIWDAKDGLGQPLASGIYIAKAKTTRGVCTAKLVYIK